MLRRRAPLQLTLAVAASVALLATACGADGDNGDATEDTDATEDAEETGSDEGESLEVLDYYNIEPDNEIYQEALEECGEEIGYAINRRAVPGGDLISTVLQQASAGTLPDVLMIDNPDLPQIAETGALTPLSELGIEAEGYVDAATEASTYEGELYGLQPVTNTIALFYNVDILEEAGVEPPTTWDELRSAAETLTDGNQYGIAFSAINTYEGTWQFLPFMWSNGGDETQIDSPENAEALQLWVDLVESGSASSSVVNWTQADANDQFAEGNAAMQINGPWQFPRLDDAEAEGLNYAVEPIPAPTEGGTVVSPFGGETWTVPQNDDEAKHEAAGQIVECLNSDENIVRFATERNTVPTKPDLMDEVVEETPEIEAFGEQLPDLRARTGQLGEDWPQAATAIYEAVQNALAGGMSPEEALQQAEAG